MKASLILTGMQLLNEYEMHDGVSRGRRQLEEAVRGGSERRKAPGHLGSTGSGTFPSRRHWPGVQMGFTVAAKVASQQGQWQLPD